MLVRILTAVVLLAAFLAALLLLDQAWFSGFVGVVVALAANEWARLTGWQGRTTYAYAAACVLAWFALLQLPDLAGGLLLGALLFWTCAVPYWLARGWRASPPALAALTGLAVLVPAGVSMVVLPRGELLILLGLVWIADSAAYFSGRAFGLHKLAPAISPGKTWEGVAGAGVCCLVYAIICAMVVPSLRAQIQGAVWVPYLFGAGFLCAVSVIGDLFESAVKRHAGAKDSGALLPGHGGVLDRIDAIAAAVPVGALLLRQLQAP